MSESPRAVTVTLFWPKGVGGGGWRLRVSGAGKETTVARISPAPPPGHGRRRFAVADEVDGVCLALTNRMAAGEPLPSVGKSGEGVFRAIVEAVRAPLTRRQLRGAE